jgi:hypothetical protein
MHLIRIQLFKEKKMPVSQWFLMKREKKKGGKNLEKNPHTPIPPPLTKISSLTSF